jgi:8-oxo-dGTP pyrophosphatase MutT (NUDIX family)
VPSWRPEALRLLEEAGYDGVVFVPEWSSGEFAGNYNDQVEWEKFGLNCADVIVFWVPRDEKGLPAFTTNVEFGRWVTSGKADLGHPPEAIKMKYLDWLYTDESDGYRHANLTLEDTINEALDMIDGWWGYSPKRTSRMDGERYVPLQIWTTPAFQDWYNALTSHGNRLEEAQQKWLFQMPKARLVFSWVLWVKVWIESEGRYKENEWIFARSDISCVALYHEPGYAESIEDTEVVLIREFRSPCRNKVDGMVVELPGGSSLKPGQDPLQVASDEVREETSLEIPAERFHFEGNRQMVATLSTHHAHLYSATLTAGEMEEAKLLANYGTSFGVEDDSERTYVEVRTVRDILHAEDIDWSMTGMILKGVMML